MILTPREIQVLGLIVNGLSNKAIAEYMNFSVSTACFHVGNLAKKFGVSRRTEIAVKALRLGIV
jgi:DNA-binding NarL/FixJ family response regulator